VARILDGETAVAALADALARVTGLVPYLTAAVNPPVDGPWLSCQALIDDPARLHRIIAATGAQIGTDDPVVASSAFVQGHSYRVLAVTLACLVSGGLVPDASSRYLSLGISRGWPSLLAFSHPRLMEFGPDADDDTISDALRFVVHHAVNSHLALLIEAVRAGTPGPVGERLLWGNLAASAATAFRTMEGCLGPSVEPLGPRFFALAPPAMQGLGSFAVIEHDGRRGWFWERTSCCLLDRLAGGIRCADCSLTPASERRSAYRESLSEP
jgi:hypothetical protein